MMFISNTWDTCVLYVNDAKQSSRRQKKENCSTVVGRVRLLDHALNSHLLCFPPFNIFNIVILHFNNLFLLIHSFSQCICAIKSTGQD